MVGARDLYGEQGVDERVVRIIAASAMTTAIPRLVSCQSADAVGASMIMHGRAVVTVDCVWSTEDGRVLLRQSLRSMSYLLREGIELCSIERRLISTQLRSHAKDIRTNIRGVS